MKKYNYKEMQRTILLALILLCNISANAQSPIIKKAAKAVFSLTTFKSDGSVLASAHGVFINFDGTAVAPLSAFQGAAKATVVDANGQASNVTVILAFNELYNMAKFRVNGNAPAICRFASAPSIKGEDTWILPYSIQTPEITKAKISNVEKFNVSYNYYIYDIKAPFNTESCPIINSKGEVLGLLSSAADGNSIHAADLNFLNIQKLNGLSINDRSLEGCAIRVALPEEAPQAELTMMVAKTKYDIPTYKQYVEEFIRKFPTSVTGYQERAEIAASEDNLSEADTYMTNAFNKVTDKAAAHSAYANIIFKKIASKKENNSPTWTYEKALSEATTAYKLSNNPGYLNQQGQILFTKGEYQKAYDIFMNLTKTPLRNPELFFEAAQCKTQLKAPEAETTALIDSCIVGFPKSPLTAPYYLIRGQLKDNKGLYREAIKDYNVYDTLMYGRADQSFYYLRYKCEMNIHWWQQALNDIAHTIVLNPKEPTYYAELAALELRINRPQDAQKAAQKCIELEPDYADGYICLGLAQINCGNKADGIKSLEKARELGDERAQGLIDKNK